jgi:ligand-binding sensor protein
VKLKDILSIEKWTEIEREINNKFGLNASVFDADGIRITRFKNWANRLCPVIKSYENGQNLICAVAHQNIALQARKTKKPVIGECDAGLLKLTVPIFVGDEFLGVVGGCGLLIDDSEVETYLISKTIGLDEELIEKLSYDINRIDSDKVKLIVDKIQERVDEVVEDFCCQPDPAHQTASIRSIDMVLIH